MSRYRVLIRRKDVLVRNPTVSRSTVNVTREIRCVLICVNVSTVITIVS